MLLALVFRLLHFLPVDLLCPSNKLSKWWLIMLLLRWYYNIIVIVIDMIFLAMAMQVYTGAAGMTIKFLTFNVNYI